MCHTTVGATTLVNCKEHQCDTYIGDPPDVETRSLILGDPDIQYGQQHWGNPFHGHGAANRYDLWLSGIVFTNVEPARRTWILKNIHLLKGKKLGCWGGNDCHGHVLARRANNYATDIEESE